MAVRSWIAKPPTWLDIRADADGATDETMSRLDDGERAVISLALATKADLVLIDDRDAVVMARALGLNATGTLGILDLAARRGLVDLAEAFARLKATSFYYRQGLLDALLSRHLHNQ